MRMWMVDPQLMCRKHLLGEHVELHMFVGTINKGVSIRGYVADGLVEVHNIVKRHADLVEEMESRGMNHKSPLPPFTPWEEGKVDQFRSLKELQRRCVFCAALQEQAIEEADIDG